jgi:hypothetical protein
MQLEGNEVPEAAPQKLDGRIVGKYHDQKLGFTPISL